MATDDRFELILNGTVLGKNTRNVFYYLQSNGPTNGAMILAQEWTAQHFDPLRALISTSAILTSVECKNLDNPEDFHVEDFGDETGNVAGDCMPPFVTFSFRYNRATLLVRNGAKRFAGVPESSVVNGVVPAGAVLTALQAFAELLDEPVTDGLGATFIPVIMRKTRVPEVGEFEEFIYAEFPLADVQYAHIGTQNSRKF